MPDIQILANHIPENAIETVASILNDYPLRIEIKSLRSNLGRFQTGVNGNPHIISMKAGLSKPLFLIVFLHETAHMIAFCRYGRYIKPHGTQWKSIFSELLSRFMLLDVFPPKVLEPLKDFIKNPRAVMINKQGFYSAFDEFSAYVPVVSIAPLECFHVRFKRFYQKLPESSTKVICRDLSSNEIVNIRKSAQVMKIERDEIPDVLKMNLLY
jgi:SprT protein